ncbi:uncharacterized protein LOC123529018 [Mercenaria mercenaria]|uniref:uncharacterized protein LOC123529018 n=1 Tax=Mercenaria mercenaria TaxID=6596 RepID=UPI00234F703A|nr:uncharacterized protein LOC123529018 [Mercenaria mercenaria]
MGTTFRNVASTVCLICVLFVIFTIGQDDAEKFNSGVQKSKIHKTGRRPDGSACKCPACMTGKDCSESVVNREPRFNNKFTFVEVNAEHHRYGVPLSYNYTTYPGDEQCPCDAFEYTITDVENVMEPSDPNRYNLFDIDNKNGKIRLANDRVSDISSSDLYRLTILVRNVKRNFSDHTMITVAREKPKHDSLYSFGADDSNGNGYVFEHSIHKRSVVPDEMNFTLTQLNSVAEARTGATFKFQLDILFPGSSIDISVELFTPDNETTVMILCDVTVASIGSNLGTTLPGDVVFESKAGWPAHMPDMATISFGTVTNNESDTVNIAASTITILYSAVMIENSLTESTKYWISAGAEYQNEMYIWVGQASFDAIVDGNQDVDLVPDFTDTMPSNIALGSSHLISVEMFLPYPYRDYTFKVFTPADTVGVMSVCGIWFNELGQNFGCGNDVSQFTNETVADPQAAGNAVAVLKLGELLNKASRDAVGDIVVADNKVALTFIAHMYPDVTKVSQLMSLGLALEVDTDTMWIGSSNFTVDPEVTTGLTDPVFMSVTSSLSPTLDDAVVGQPFSLTYEIQVPPPTTDGVASHYVLEILAPFDGTPIFSVCSFKVTSVGQDLPCLRTEDLVTEYSSRVTGSTPSESDRAIIDLGHVTNLELFGDAGDDIITLEAILMPLASHSSAVANSEHNVSLGVTVGASSVHLVDSAVSISGVATVTPVTNSTAPAFTMSFYDTTDTVPVTGSTKVIVDMVTSRNVTYDEMDMEFLMPVGTEYSYFHVCRVDIAFNGKNMPCMTPEWYAKMIQYSSQFDNYEADRARLNIGSMCNLEFVDNTDEDKTTFEVYLKVLDRADLVDMTSKWISTGLQYSSTNLWVGQLRLDATRGTSVSPTKSSYTILTRNTTVSPIPIGLTVSYSLLLKIGKGDTAHIQVKATAQLEGAHICTVRVVSAGSNLPCVVDEVTTRTYTNWPSESGRQIVELDAGFVTNYGSDSENMTANNYYDADTMVVEVLVRANPVQPAGTYPVDIEVYYDTDRLVKSTFTQSDFITTEDLSGVATTVTDPVNVTVIVGEITGSSDNTTSVTLGEAKRVLIFAVIPEGSSYDLEFSFIIPSADVGKVEICDAAIVSVGDNLPCIDVLSEAVISSSGDSAIFNLGFVCSRVLRPGDQKANTVVFEAYVRVLDNGNAAVGDTVTVTASMRSFSSTVEIDSVVFTVEDPSSFVDRVHSLDGVTNDTLISLNWTSPISMNIAENVTVTATVSVPKLSVSRFLFDVDLPVEDSACLTVTDIRVVGSVGRNVLCVPPDVNTKGIVYSPVYNASVGNSQINYAYIDIGIVTNTGLTYRRNTFTAGDDDVLIEFDIQMADCASSDNGKVHKLSIGNKVANYIFIYDFDVQVVRDSNEKPDIAFEMITGAGSTSSVIHVEGIAYHTENSTAEGKNTSLFVSLPAYQQLTSGALVVTSNQSCSSIHHTDTFVQIDCDDFFFTDVLTFTAEIAINSSVILPVGFSGWDSVAQGWVGTNYVSRYTTYDAEDWFPYPISGENELSYSVEGGIDTSSLIALGLEDRNIVADCQITSSLGNSGPASDARLNNIGAWVPLIRDSYTSRYLVVYFGNQHKFSKVAVQQDEGNADLVTELAVEYTEDADVGGLSWFGEEVVSLGASPTTLKNVTLSGRKARGVRITLTNDTAYGVLADVGVKFEFYGQKLTSDKTQAQACSILESSLIQTPAGYPAFGPRSFIVAASGKVYVCDRQSDSKVYKGGCTSSADNGATWSKLDTKVTCMIGYEGASDRLYAYAPNQKTVMVSEAGYPWESVPLGYLEEDQLKTTWISAIIVPELASPELDRATPHSMYKIQNWGPTIDGMFESNVIKMKWADA